jgi:RNA polymerase sigma-70 factor (ECF subfamily)
MWIDQLKEGPIGRAWALSVEREAGPESDEAALVAAAQADPTAFDALYRRYLARVYRYLRAQVGSDEDAADLTQQVFLRALDALPRYRPRGVPFTAWLFSIARHAAIDAYRRKRATVAWEALPEALQPAAGEQDPEIRVLRLEALARVGDLLAQLDLAKRELLALRFAAGLSASEIAAVVGRSPAAVKKQLTRTLQMLKEHYHEG